LVFGMLAFGVLGINLGFHRLITHRGFSGSSTRSLSSARSPCSFRRPCGWPCSRRPHHHADNEQDPHSPLRGFFWAHFGWLLLMRSGDMRSRPLIERYAKDVMRDPLYAMLERRKNWSKISFLMWLAYFAGGYSWVMGSGGSSGEAMQFGSGLVTWGARSERWSSGIPPGPSIR